MRGKIIQYNGADGSGTIVVDGRQHPFVLAAWRGNSAPAVNKTVEITLDGDTISAITAVGDDVLLKEKAAELGGKLGSLWTKIPSGAAANASANDSAPGASAQAASAPSAPGGPITAQAVLQRYGKAIPIAWVLFVLGTFAFNVVSVQLPMMGNGFGKSFFDVADLFSQMGVSGSGGMVKLLLVLGYLSIAVPALWRDRRAWLTLAIPLLAVLWAIFSVIHTLDSVGGGMAQGVSDFFSLGFGFYLTLLAALALAVLGVRKYLSAA